MKERRYTKKHENYGHKNMMRRPLLITRLIRHKNLYVDCRAVEAHINAYNRSEYQPAVWKRLQSIWNKTPIQANDSIMCNDTYIIDDNQDNSFR